MAEAFNNVGNHLVSDSAAAINAGGDDDESVLGRGTAPGRVRRRRGDDDEEGDIYDDDDLESLISQPVNGAPGAQPPNQEEEVELPPHACAYVILFSDRREHPLLTYFPLDTAASTIPPASSNALAVTSGSAALAATPRPHISSTTLYEPATRKYSYTLSPLLAILHWNAIDVELGMSSYWDSSLPNLTHWSSCYADRHAARYHRTSQI